jgi:hypothetical protein
VESTGNIRQVQGFTGPGVGLGCNVAHDIRMILLPLNSSKKNCLECTIGEEIFSRKALGHIISGAVKSVVSLVLRPRSS